MSHSETISCIWIALIVVMESRNEVQRKTADPGLTKRSKTDGISTEFHVKMSNFIAEINVFKPRYKNGIGLYS